MSETHNKQEAPIRVWLSCRVDGDLASAALNLPATRGDLDERLKLSRIPLDRIPDLVVSVRETSIIDLRRSLPRNPDLNELNYLAARIAEMSETDRDEFESVIESNRHCGSLAEIINTTRNMEQFELYPGDFSGRELGGILAEMHHHEFWAVLDRLQTSENPSDQGFAEYVERMQESLDYGKYGELARQAEGGVLTDNGYLLLPDGPLPQRYTGPQDIPAEHLLSPLPEPERRPSLLDALRAAKDAYRAADADRADTPEKWTPSGPEL